MTFAGGDRADGGPPTPTGPDRSLARANNVKEAEFREMSMGRARAAVFLCFLGTATFAAAAAGSEEFQAAMEADNAKWLQAYNTQDAKTLVHRVNSMLFSTVAEEPWRTDAAHSISQIRLSSRISHPGIRFRFLLPRGLRREKSTRVAPNQQRK